jgi:hypothetical protein
MPVTQAKAPQALVRGGTTTTASDKALMAQREDTRRRRAAQDQMRMIKRADPESTVLKTHRLGGQSSHASIVLALKHPKDTTIMDWMVCELSQQGTETGVELVLIMCCPRCVFTLGRPAGEAQLHITQTNRQFFFTPKPPKWNQEGGHIWRNPKDPNEVVTIAGTIDLPEWAYCPQQGCRWRFTIEDSVIHTR